MNIGDKHFDDKIRDVLNELSPELGPKAWELFEKQLDTEAREMIDIDKVIAEKLTFLEVSSNGADWNRMEEQLKVADALEDQVIDTAIYGKLSQLEVSLNGADWNKMEEKLEVADILEDQAIDTAIYDRLSQLDVPYQTSHWQLMLKRLEREFTLRGKLYKYKVMELALMLLLLLTIGNFFPVSEVFDSKTTLIPPFNSMNNVNKAAEVQEDKGNNKEILDQDTQNRTLEGTNTQALGVPIAELENQETSSLNNAEVENLKIEKIATANSITQNSLGKTIASEEMEANLVDVPQKLNQRLNRTSLPFVSVLPPKQITLDQISESIYLNPVTKETKIPAPLLNTEQNTSLLAAIDVLALEYLHPTNVGISLVHLQSLKNRPQWRLNTFAAADFNLIFTPYDDLFENGPDTTQGGGYGGGITFSMKKGNWEIETGGLYTFKRYVPGTPIHLFETVKYYIEEDFKGIQMDILQVPLNIHYHFLTSPKWRMYALGGTSLNMVLSPVYELERQLTPSVNALIPPSSAPGGECSKCESLSRLKTFPEGLLEGGSFKENSYFTANVGFGVERSLTTRWSFFLQPTYQHYFVKKGIGPNQDKIYALSIYIGTKVNFN